MIHKHSREDGHFSMAPDSLILDTRLSALELRIMLYLLGRPTSWNPNPSHLASVFSCTKRGVNKALSRLIEFGYMTAEGDEYKGILINRRFDVFASARPVEKQEAGTPVPSLGGDVGTPVPGKREPEFPGSYIEGSVDRVVDRVVANTVEVVEVVGEEPPADPKMEEAFLGFERVRKAIAEHRAQETLA